MRVNFFLLMMLIGVAPAILPVDGYLAYCLVGMSASVAVAMVAISIKPDDARFLLILIRKPLAVAVIPAIWMAIQLLPLPTYLFVNPIWESASSALGQPLLGSITVDTGATLTALFRYLSFVAVAFASMASAVDREQARWIFIVSMMASVAAAFLLIAHDLGGFKFLSVEARLSALDIAAIAVVLTAAGAMELIDHLANRRSAVTATYLLVLMSRIVGFVLCCLVLIAAKEFELIFAALLGTLPPLAVLVVRRLAFDRWMPAGAAVLIAFAVMLFVILHNGTRPTDWTLALAHGNPEAIEVTKRILASEVWTGTGAGTFSRLIPIYHDVNDVTVATTAPTAAAAIAIELGQPIFAAGVACMIFGAIALLFGAVQRGRDWLYSTTGSGIIVMALLVAFTNSGISGTSVLVFAGAILGLGLAQRVSRAR